MAKSITKTRINAKRGSTGGGSGTVTTDGITITGDGSGGNPLVAQFDYGKANAVANNIINN